VAELRPHIETLRQSVDPVVIGSGAPNFARGFQQQMNVPDLPIYSDEERLSFTAAGMKPKQGLHALHKSTVRFVMQFWKHPQTKVLGDPFQLGGVVFVRPGGEVTYRFASEWAGQHPPIPTLLDQASKAARR
jgi:hypothetical protein